MEWPERGMVKRERVVNNGWCIDHGRLRSSASVSSRMEVLVRLRPVVPPEMYSVVLTRTYVARDEEAREGGGESQPGRTLGVHEWRCRKLTDA
jgi:hypothetical protein